MDVNNLLFHSPQFIEWVLYGNRKFVCYLQQYNYTDLLSLFSPISQYNIEKFIFLSDDSSIDEFFPNDCQQKVLIVIFPFEANENPVYSLNLSIIKSIQDSFRKNLEILKLNWLAQLIPNRNNLSICDLRWNFNPQFRRSQEYCIIDLVTDLAIKKIVRVNIVDDCYLSTDPHHYQNASKMVKMIIEAFSLMDESETKIIIDDRIPLFFYKLLGHSDANVILTNSRDSEFKKIKISSIVEVDWINFRSKLIIYINYVRDNLKYFKSIGDGSSV